MEALRLRSRRWLFALAFAAATTAGTSTAAAQEPAEPAAGIAVHATLGSCDESDGRTVCEIRVSFAAVPRATRYEVEISAPGGDVLVSDTATPEDRTFSIPYRGDGTYRVHVTGFGDGPDA